MRTLQEYVYKALQDIPLLLDEDRHAISTLGLPIYESLVIGHLKAAGELLARDDLFTMAMRQEAWARWLSAITAALDGALRYRENELLAIVVKLCAALYPALHPRAVLTGFKILDDAARYAEQGPVAIHKRERRRHYVRLQDIIVRVSAWQDAAGELYHSEVDNPTARAHRLREGWQEVSAVRLSYHRPGEVLRLLEAILPVRWIMKPDGVVIAARLPGP
ncbi:MAG: hypothetical protein Kow00124_21840 [Anaerolineae bacterium]